MTHFYAGKPYSKRCYFLHNSRSNLDENTSEIDLFQKTQLNFHIILCMLKKSLMPPTRNDFSVQVMRMKLCKMMQNARTENGATGCLRTLACFSRLPAMSMHVLWHVYSGPWLALACLWWHVYAVTCCLCRTCCLRIWSAKGETSPSTKLHSLIPVVHHHNHLSSQRPCMRVCS